MWAGDHRLCLTTPNVHLLHNTFLHTPNNQHMHILFPKRVYRQCAVGSIAPSTVGSSPHWLTRAAVVLHMLEQGEGNFKGHRSTGESRRRCPWLAVSLSLRTLAQH
jgi:hypothetical protein